MTKTIRREIVIPQPREQVWEAITNSATLAEWMYPNDFEPRVGHQFTFRVPPNPKVGFDGLVVRCEVIECEPPSQLAFSWSAGGLVDTRVSFRLEPDGDATRVHFEHSGFDITPSFGEQAFKGAEYGWAKMLKQLADIVSRFRIAKHLLALESAISDVGYWTWWTATLPGTFQVEFGGTQIWNPPSGDGQPPSSRIALRFRKPQLIYFLTLEQGVPTEWPDQLQRDELDPPSVDHEVFTLSSAELCGRLVDEAVAIRSLVGEPSSTPAPITGEALLGFRAGPFGLVVAAESLGVFNHHSELDGATVLANIGKWWEYWREYWRRRDTPDPLPRDYACEVTIPLAPEAEPDAAPDRGLV